MPPDDGEWAFCQSWSGPTSQEVELCSVRMLTAENVKTTDNMDRIISSPTKKYSFITRSPRIWRSKSMTREYIYFPIISSSSDHVYTSLFRNVKSLSSLQGKDEKEMMNEELKNRQAFKVGKEGRMFNIPHSEHEYGNTCPQNLSPPQFQHDLTGSDRHIDYQRKMMKTKSKDRKSFTLSNEELNKDDASYVEDSAKSYELSDSLTEDRKKPVKMKRSPRLRAWNPSRNRKPVSSSFKPDYNVLEPNSVVALSHQFEKTPSPNKASIPDKKKIELYNRNEIKKRRRIRTEPVFQKKEPDSSKIRANSLPDENTYRKNNETEISPKSVKKIKIDWEMKADEECSLSLSRQASQNKVPSYNEHFIQSARQMQVLNEYKQRASTSVSNLKNQFEIFSTPSPNLTANMEGSVKSNKLFQFEECSDETPSDKITPKIVISKIKDIRMKFEQQSLTKREDSDKLKAIRQISPSKSPPILNLLAKFDPSVSCGSPGRDSTASSGSFSDNEVFDCDENSGSRNKEMENGEIFVSRLTERKKKVQADDYLRKREKEKAAELNRLIEQRDRDAIMAEKREVERLKKIEEEREKDQREKEREQERRRIEAERVFQRKRLEEEKKLEKLQREIEKEKQRVAIEEEVKRAKKLREDEQRKEIEEKEMMKLKRIEEEKELEEFEREKLIEARELMEAELQKEKEDKLRKEEERMKQLQIERGLYSENDMSEGIEPEADVDNLIGKFEKKPKHNESDNETSPCSEPRPLSHGGSTLSLSNCRPLNPDELQHFMGMTTSDTFMRTQSLRVKSNKKNNSNKSRMKRSNSMSEKSSPILVPNKPRTSVGPAVVNKVPENCRQLRPEEWKFFLGDMTSSMECEFNFSDSE